MLTSVNPKLPMRNKKITKSFYIDKLGFCEFGNADFADYLMVEKDNVQVHFFLFQELDPSKNYGQMYLRTDSVDELFNDFRDRKVTIHPNGQLETKPWRQREFSVLDPDNNLLTFGQGV